MILLLLIGMLAAEGSVTKADQVFVVKSQRTLTLLSHGKVLRTYKVALGGSPVGAKEQQGDHKTPEGHYLLDRRSAVRVICGVNSGTIRDAKAGEKGC